MQTGRHKQFNALSYRPKCQDRLHVWIQVAGKQRHKAETDDLATDWRNRFDGLTG